MKRFTQAEFDSFDVSEYGKKFCPYGDYSDVVFGNENNLEFESGCVLGAFSRLGSDCKLGEGCQVGMGSLFGSQCELGNECILDSHCVLGEACHIGHGVMMNRYCKIGEQCFIGDYARIGDSCIIGEDCTLGDGCVLGPWCDIQSGCEFGSYCAIGAFCLIAKECKFGAHTSMEDGKIKDAVYLIIRGIGKEKREGYFFMNGEGQLFVRIDDRLADKNEFVKYVCRRYSDENVRKSYLMAAEYAEQALSIEQEWTKSCGASCLNMG